MNINSKEIANLTLVKRFFYTHFFSWQYHPCLLDDKSFLLSKNDCIFEFQPLIEAWVSNNNLQAKLAGISIKTLNIINWMIGGKQASGWCLPIELLILTVILSYPDPDLHYYWNYTLICNSIFPKQWEWVISINWSGFFPLSGF